MKGYIMKIKVIKLLSLIFITSLLLTGCGKDAKKAEFEKYFMDFCDQVTEIDGKIKAIDPNSETAPAELLANLDELNKLFGEMSSTKFPKDYDYLVTLAEESGSFMNLAVENYHAAFEAPVFDEESANIASEYYARSYKRLKYMITFMQGDVPDTNEISYSTADSSEDTSEGE